MHNCCPKITRITYYWIVTDTCPVFCREQGYHRHSRVRPVPLSHTSLYLQKLLYCVAVPRMDCFLRFCFSLGNIFETRSKRRWRISAWCLHRCVYNNIKWRGLLLFNNILCEIIIYRIRMRMIFRNRLTAFYTYKMVWIWIYRLCNIYVTCWLLINNNAKVFS